HDEYMYQMLKFNKTHYKHSLPNEALLIIRYHSCYVWHTHNEYLDLMSPSDHHIKELTKTFNKFDLYTKQNMKNQTNNSELKQYYENLIKKYFPGKLYW